ncbi:hypothetical protein [Stenotrophomonas sp.]|uniref:hypothetical protein n=1 Tax=Stenotrophomonas sp. TaxID=69392 RepID=UPI00289802E9|nr:hypothetical protein [Stenotrophomonas sp.]
MMTKLRARASATVLAIMTVLLGCGQAGTPLDRRIAAAEDDVAKGGRGQVKLNPAPQEAIGFTWKVEGAPGTFAKVTSLAQYDVINDDECGYIHPVAGTPGRMTTSEPVTLTKVSDTEYAGTVYRDLLQDGNYYDRGLCHWELTGVAVNFRAEGKAGATRFQSYIGEDRLVSGGLLILHYAKMDYPRDPVVDNYPSSGSADLQKFKPELRSQTFKVTVGRRSAQE